MWLPHINGGVTVARAHVHTSDPAFISRERLAIALIFGM